MEKIKLILKIIGIAFGILVLVVIMLIIVGVTIAPDYTKIKTPAGFSVNIMQYLTLDEDTKIWISVWLPDNLKSEEKIPALIETSRYSKKLEMGWLYKVMQTYLGYKDSNYEAAKNDNDHGYAYVYVQSPGSCQSTGPRSIEYPPNEIEAMELAIDWIVKQPWSNKKVGAYGRSYSGTTADMICATMRPELKAVHPKAPDFDVYASNTKPGGLGSQEFVRIWGGMVRAMDNDDICEVMSVKNQKKLSIWEKYSIKSYMKGLKRPKGEDIKIFKQALKDHTSNIYIEKLLLSMEYKDSTVPEISQYSLDDINLYNYKDKIEKANVNTYTKVGWMDAAVAEGALQKYLTFNTPQILVIYPAGHLSSEYVDPFGRTISITREEKKKALDTFYDYFDKHLKNDGGKEQRKIRYYTYGENKWRETSIWPPQYLKNQKWYFASEGELANEFPLEETGSDKYKVDFTATTGFSNRWLAQMGQSVQYEDRKDEDKKLLTYTSIPFEQDTEVTGSPTVTMYVVSTHIDGAFHVYLEDVAPDGRVSYLTEGLLRAIHRKKCDPATASFIPLGVYHSYKEADSMPLVPGEITEIAITMYPISTVFRKGHSMRIAIAGHDHSMNNKYPKEGTPILTFERNSVFPSNIEIQAIVR